MAEEGAAAILVLDHVGNDRDRVAAVIERQHLHQRIGVHEGGGLGRKDDEDEVGRSDQLHRLGIDTARRVDDHRSEEHTSELQSLMRISYAVFCLQKKSTDLSNLDNS